MGLRYTQALADRAQAWVSLSTNAKRYPDGLLELATIWAAINQLPLPECIRQCQYSERHAAVVAYLREFSRLQNPDTVSNLKFLLAAAFATQSLVHESYNKAVTADNLTDEDAQFFITHGYAHAFTKANGKPLSEADIAKIKAKVALDDDSDEASTVVQVTPANALVPAADLLAEQTAHKATQQELEGATGVLAQEQASHETTAKALEAEKEVTATLTAERNELAQQLTEAQQRIDALSALAPKDKKAPRPTGDASGN